jgi:hypothetical protein
MSRRLVLGVAVLTVGFVGFLLAGPGWAGPDASASPKKTTGERRRANDKAERFQRLETAQGIVYVWWPRNYNKREARIVVYVPG